jgi:hypothetical protein
LPLSDNGFEFRAVFTNASGSATTDPATLTVISGVPPAVTTQPTNQTGVDGGTVTFSAAASGVPAPTVQWQFSTDGGSTWSDVDPVIGTSSPLMIGVSLSDNGSEYRGVFTNAAGSATTDPATLTVLPLLPAGCTKFQGCNLSGRYLSGASLAGDNLQGANLAGANLSGADLSGANLQSDNLSGANLSGADLSGANVKGTNFNNVIWSNTTCPDGTNSDNDGGTCLGDL